MPSWVAPFQAIQTALAALLGLGYAWVAVRGRFPFLRLFCALCALKAAILVAFPAYTRTTLYRDAEFLILALVVLGVLEAWWLLWPPLRLPFLGWQIAVAGALASLTGLLPGETDPGLAFSRLRRQFWFSVALFILVASIDAWRRGVPVSSLWVFWNTYAAAHVISQLPSYHSYETLAHRWAGYFATAFLYDALAGLALLLYGLSESGGGSSAPT